MADGNFGGGGSVEWSVMADHVDTGVPASQSNGTGPNDKKRWKQSGLDYPDLPVPLFVVKIELPDELKNNVALREAWLKQLTVQGGELQIPLAVKDNKKQIQVLWGESVTSQMATTQWEAVRSSLV